MTCHLHDLVEHLTSDRVRTHALIAQDDRIHTLLQRAALIARNAMCFHIGNSDSCAAEEIDVVPELVRLPFAACWFETQHATENGVSRLGVLAEESDDVTVWYVFMFDALTRRWCLVAWASIVGIAEGKLAWGVSPNTVEASYASGVVDFLTVVAAFLSALNCSNVRKVEHLPEAKLQRARAKRGKLPLFSFWTLHLNLEQAEDGDALGGTHASPRLHLRRGHARQYAPGKWTWVQPHVVGNKTLGIVHKDYAAP